MDSKYNGRPVPEQADWHWQFKNRLQRLQDLPGPVQKRIIQSFISLQDLLRDKKAGAAVSRRSPAHTYAGLDKAELATGLELGTIPFPLPLAITPYFLGLANPEDKEDPILQQMIPSAREL